MKGVVFTEFLGMVEDNYGYEVVDRVIEKANLPNNGAYTQVGTYDHKEIYRLVGALSEELGAEVSALVKFFGKHLFKVFLNAYPDLFTQSDNSFDFLANVHGYIHVEVKKIYPDAELPHFSTSVNEEGKMVMVYTSSRKLSDLAHGLIESTLEHYEDEYEIESQHLIEDGSKVSFVIKLI